jgi:hypothetical protein
MMVALLLYSHCCGTRSARAIERACEVDIAYRVIAAHTKPDHATIARFVERHERALAGLSARCSGSRADRAGQGRDLRDRWDQVAADASRDATRDHEQIAREILEEATAIDAAEDELYGEARGVGRTGRRFSPGATPKPYTPAAVPEGSINTTDLDSRLVKGMRGWLPTRPGWDSGLYAFMRRVLPTERGAELYRLRQQLIEPVLANTAPRGPARSGLAGPLQRSLSPGFSWTRVAARARQACRRGPAAGRPHHPGARC